MTGSALLVAAVRRLGEAGVPDAALDARRLLAHALGIAPDRLTLHLPEAVPDAVAAAYEALISRRAAREPVAQITGRRMFYGREFLVTADVLDPRPETEVLIEAALAAPFETVLDLGTGSGCILLTLLAEMEGSRGVGTDVSGPACDVAEENARRLGMGDRARIVHTDWWAGVTGSFDLIVSNPPYIAAAEMAGLEPEVREWEPRGALTDEADGLGAYRTILSGAPQRLVPGGRLILEIGAGQGAAVVDLAHRAGFTEVRRIRDLDGRDRVIGAEVAPDVPF
ncbi:release factor glutamine methyltransferase [Wenxinia marina]|uniref:peptide chain release factor N(5)-glutamine methyltransferase n=1 Tax=Wenxinia marina TaxID=390641 RepID=UPI000379EF5D|nr:peptide chain release factor N(5)-glutamine methyltransferase [Wenxinia marina]GGL74362.1 release factor glutamine methyltransferase [Wenxinia marina]